MPPATAETEMVTPVPGRTLELSGWTVDDFHDPDILATIGDARVEIADGMLLELPMSGHQTTEPRDELVRLLNVTSHERKLGLKVKIETSLELAADRVPLPDMLVLTPEQAAAQRAEAGRRMLERDRFEPIYVTPALVVGVDQRRHRAARPPD